MTIYDSTLVGLVTNLADESNNLVMDLNKGKLSFKTGFYR